MSAELAPAMFAERRSPRSKRSRLAGVMARTGVTKSLLRLPAWRGVLIINYHRIGVASLSQLHRGLFSATPEQLDAHLQVLCRHFDVISLRDLDGPLLKQPGRRLMVTFDDCYRDLYADAAPILRAHGVRAGLFCCSGFIDGTAPAWWDEIAWILRQAPPASLPAGKWGEPLTLSGVDPEAAIDATTRRYWTLPPAAAEALVEALAERTGAGRRPAGSDREDFVSWNMLRELQAEGHEVGAHTATHPILARLPEAHQQAEIATSMSRIEQELGRRPDALAYPVGLRGTFDAGTRRAASDSRVRLAFSNYGGRPRAGAWDALDIPRVPGETLREPGMVAGALALPQLLARPHA